MKACKKCKKQVANKAKICKYCGADVTKCKVIPKASNTPTKTIKSNVKSKTAKKKTVLEKPIVVDKKKNIIEADIKADNKTDNKKSTLKKSLKTIVEKINFVKKNKPKAKGNVKTKPKKKLKKTVKKKSKKNNRPKIEFSVKEISVILKKSKDVILSALRKVGIFFASVLAALLYGISHVIEFVSEILNDFVELLIKLFILVAGAIKKAYFLAKDKLSVVFSARKAKKRIKKRNAKIAKINNQVRHEMQEKGKILKAKQTDSKHASKMLKPILITAFVLGFFGGFSILGLDVYRYFSDTGNSIATVSQKATRDKIFTMKDVISYNDVDYRIMKVETSMGNSYKSPKEGNQFLIVTVYIRNNSSKKVPYSYENWTMSNSKGEEKKRFFSSINVDDALYSGQLVIGGIKTGSMVFEQPINDSKLRMNYYELKVDENGNEVLDQAKRVFSVSIKVPETKKEDTKEEVKSKTENVKKG